MANTPNLNLIELIYDNTKKVKDFLMNEIIGKTNSNNTKIDTAIAEKITQVALKSSLPTSPTTHNNLYIVYGDIKDNNGQYRWNGTTYEKISTQLDYATKAEAEAGADNTKVMTPQRVRDFFIANGGGSGGVTNVVFQSGKKYYKFTATAVTDNFEIPSNLFNPTTDVIELIYGGNIPIIKDENYTLVGNLVTFIGYSLNINDDIHCLITNTAYSYNALVDTPDLSLKQNKTDDTLGTTSKEIVGAINENKYNIDLKADKPSYGDFYGDIFSITGDSYKTFKIRYLTDVTNAPSTNINDWCILEYIPLKDLKKFRITPYTATYNGVTQEAVVDINGLTVYTPWNIIPTSQQMEQKADKIIPSEPMANKYKLIFETNYNTYNDNITLEVYNATNYLYKPVKLTFMMKQHGVSTLPQFYSYYEGVESTNLIGIKIFNDNGKIKGYICVLDDNYGFEVKYASRATIYKDSIPIANPNGTLLYDSTVNPKLVATTDKIDNLLLPFASGVTDWTTFGQRTHYQKDSLGNVRINCWCQFTNTTKIDNVNGFLLATMPSRYRPIKSISGIAKIYLNGVYTGTDTTTCGVVVTDTGMVVLLGLDFIGTNNVAMFSIEYSTT